MQKIKCNLIVKETQSASAKVLDDLKEKENENFDVEEMFNKAIKNEDLSGATGKGPSDNNKNS